MYLPRDVNSITSEMVAGLVANGIPENVWIDYKATLPGASSDDRRDFLIDVTAFANTVGGHLVYGMEAVDGVPANLVGLSGINPDQTVLRLENMLRDSVEPRVPGIAMRYIPVNEHSGAFVISIPRSWSQPHAIRVGQGTFRFYGRNSAGAYPLSVDEVRALFGQTGSILERVRRFRVERVAQIAAGEGAKVLRKRDTEPDDRFRGVVLHIVPLASLDDHSLLDPPALRQDSVALNRLIPLTGSLSIAYTFDGLLTFNGDNNQGEVKSYLQVFRNATLEAADSNALNIYMPDLSIGWYLPSPALEHAISVKVRDALAFYRSRQIPAPVAVLLTVIGANGYSIGRGDLSHWGVLEHRIRQRELFFPEVLIDDTSLTFEQVAAQLKPAFDRLWNASGIERCPRFQWINNQWLPTFPEHL